MSKAYEEAARDLARRAFDESVDQALARDHEESTKITFLETFLAAIADGGGLLAVSSRVPRRASGWIREFDKDGPHVKYFDEGVDGEAPYARGVLVAGEQRPTANPMLPFQRLKGEALYVTPDGRFFTLEFKGEHNRDGDTFHWEALPCFLSLKSLVGDRWPIGEIAKSIADELEACAKGAKKATARHHQIVAKVRAVSVLLEGVK